MHVLYYKCVSTLQKSRVGKGSPKRGGRGLRCMPHPPKCNPNNVHLVGLALT